MTKEENLKFIDDVVKDLNNPELSIKEKARSAHRMHIRRLSFEDAMKISSKEEFYSDLLDPICDCWEFIVRPLIQDMEAR